MRLVVGVLAVAGCYAPASIAPCTVSCDSTTPCPGELECRSDGLCHAPGNATCAANDGGPDADEPPSMAADLIAWGADGVRVATTTGARFKSPAVWLATTTTGDRANLVCDVDGDGRGDLVAWNMNTRLVSLSTDSAFGPFTSWQTGTFDANFYLCGDATGDGRSDLIRVNTTDTMVAESTAGAFLTQTTWSSDPFQGTRGNFVANLNGDARADLIAWNDNSVGVKVSVPGPTYSTGVTWYAGSTFSSNTNTVGDVDGDTLTDLIAWNTSTVYVQLCTSGVGFSAPTLWSMSPFNGTVANLVADVNGDGRADLIAVSDVDVKVALSTGTSFATPTTWMTFSELDGVRGYFAINVDVRN